MFKRIVFTVLICVCLNMVNVPIATATEPADSECIWIETENYTSQSGDFMQLPVGQASNGSVLLLSNAQETSTVTYQFSVDNEDVYNIWMLSANPMDQWFSRYKYDIDGVFYAEPDFMWNGEGLYTVPNHGMPVCWVKMRTVRLSAGEHTFTITVDSLRPAGGGMYQVFDSIALVPTNWNWKPDNSLDKPHAIYNAGLWIESDEYIDNQGEYKLEADGKASGMYGMYINTDVIEPNMLSYAVNPTVSGEYDVYMLASAPSVTYNTAIKYKAGDQTDYSRVLNPSLKRPYVSGNGAPAEWFKLTTVTLEKGKIFELSLLADENRPMDNLIWQWIDTILFVKSGSPFNLSDVEIDGSIPYDVVELDKGLLDFADVDLSALKENIKLPSRGFSGSFINWSTSDNSIATVNNGTLEILRSIEGDRNVTLTATINPYINGVADTNISVTKAFDVTVAKQDDYTVSNMSLKYSDGTDIINGLEAGRAINATVTVKNNQTIGGSAVAMLLLYDKDGMLELAAALSQPLLSGQDLTYPLSLTLPQDVSGASVELRIWNNMQEMISLSEGIVK